jgi:hypothetical protein
MKPPTSSVVPSGISSAAASHLIAVFKRHSLPEERPQLRSAAQPVAGRPVAGTTVRHTLPTTLLCVNAAEARHPQSLSAKVLDEESMQAM